VWLSLKIPLHPARRDCKELRCKNTDDWSTLPSQGNLLLHDGSSLNNMQQQTSPSRLAGERRANSLANKAQHLRPRGGASTLQARVRSIQVSWQSHGCQSASRQFGRPVERQRPGPKQQVSRGEAQAKHGGGLGPERFEVREALGGLGAPCCCRRRRTPCCRACCCSCSCCRWGGRCAGLLGRCLGVPQPHGAVGGACRCTTGQRA
jgi:hypothetical protein